MIPARTVHLPTVLLALLLDAALLLFVSVTVHAIHGWTGVIVVVIASFLSNYLYHHAKRPRPRRSES